MKNIEVKRDCDLSQAVETLNANERLKFDSRYLRGSIEQGLGDTLTRAVPGDDPLLLKFHGIYQQDNRDRRADRKRRRLEPDYQFMVRLRIPGGRCTVDQWRGLDSIANTFAERGLRITTRQTIQLHGVRKPELKRCMQAIRDIGLDTIAACGDDSRGVVCGANPALSKVQGEVWCLAMATSARLIPKTRAYPEIWYEEPAVAQSIDEDPQYGPLYLPRKFKVGFAIPPENDVDIYAQDLGYIAVVDAGVLSGFDVCVGGGMGQLDTRDDSYPRLAEVIGFIPAQEAPTFAEVVMGIQRDYGDRMDRHRARFKYTLDRLGTDWFLATLAERRGKPLAPARDIRFTHNGDHLGWLRGDDGRWHVTLYIESGRIDGALQDQIQGLFQQFGGTIRLTPNQNITLCNIDSAEREQLEYRLADLGLEWRLRVDTQSLNTLSCVALPTCGLAMAESERYLPHFLERFNGLKAQHGLRDRVITLRITGCPNGCARPYLAEIALTGRAPGLYNLYLGGGFHGQRLNRLFAENVNENGIFSILDPLLARFSQEADSDVHFGDFLMEAGVIEQPLLIRKD